LLPDISHNFFLTVSLIFIQVLSRVLTHLAFEFHLSFQKLREYQLIGSSLLLVEFILYPLAAFEFLFSYWMMNTYNRILSQHLKIETALYWLLKREVASLVAFKKLQEHIRALLKNWERFARSF